MATFVPTPEEFFFFFTIVCYWLFIFIILTDLWNNPGPCQRQVLLHQLPCECRAARGRAVWPASENIPWRGSEYHREGIQGEAQDWAVSQLRKSRLQGLLWCTGSAPGSAELQPPGNLLWDCGTVEHPHNHSNDKKKRGLFEDLTCTGMTF